MIKGECGMWQRYSNWRHRWWTWSLSQEIIKRSWVVKAFGRIKGHHIFSEGFIIVWNRPFGIHPEEIWKSLVIFYSYGLEISQFNPVRFLIIKHEAQWKALQYIFLKQLVMMYLNIIFESKFRLSFAKPGCLKLLRYDLRIPMWSSSLIPALWTLIKRQDMLRPIVLIEFQNRSINTQLLVLGP